MWSYEAAARFHVLLLLLHEQKHPALRTWSVRHRDQFCPLIVDLRLSARSSRLLTGAMLGEPASNPPNSLVLPAFARRTTTPAAAAAVAPRGSCELCGSSSARRGLVRGRVGTGARRLRSLLALHTYSPPDVIGSRMPIADRRMVSSLVQSLPLNLPLLLYTFLPSPHG